MKFLDNIFGGGRENEVQNEPPKPDRTADSQESLRVSPERTGVMGHLQDMLHNKTRDYYRETRVFFHKPGVQRVALGLAAVALGVILTGTFIGGESNIAHALSDNNGGILDMGGDHLGLLNNTGDAHHLGIFDGGDNGASMHVDANPSQIADNSTVADNSSINNPDLGLGDGGDPVPFPGTDQNTPFPPGFRGEEHTINPNHQEIVMKYVGNDNPPDVLNPEIKPFPGTETPPNTDSNQIIINDNGSNNFDNLGLNPDAKPFPGVENAGGTNANVDQIIAGMNSNAGKDVDQMISGMNAGAGRDIDINALQHQASQGGHDQMVHLDVTPKDQTPADLSTVSKNPGGFEAKDLSQVSNNPEHFQTKDLSTVGKDLGHIPAKDLSTVGKEDVHSKIGKLGGKLGQRVVKKLGGS